MPLTIGTRVSKVESLTNHLFANIIHTFITGLITTFNV